MVGAERAVGWRALRWETVSVAAGSMGEQKAGAGGGVNGESGGGRGTECEGEVLSAAGLVRSVAAG